MPDYAIESITTWDARFPLPDGAGMDALHTNSEYCFAVTLLGSRDGLCGTGIALTLGEGNRLVCEAIELLARPLAKMEIEELMSDFGRMSRTATVETADRSDPGRSCPATGSKLSGGDAW